MRIELLRVVMTFLPMALSSKVLAWGKSLHHAGVEVRSPQQGHTEQRSPRCANGVTLTLPAEAALRAIQASFGCPAAMTPLQVLGGGSCMDAQRFLIGLMDLIVGITGAVVAHRRRVRGGIMFRRGALMSSF
jgi:hypothetical protein